jgi:hypothetical protein
MGGGFGERVGARGNGSAPLFPASWPSPDLIGGSGPATHDNRTPRWVCFVDTRPKAGHDALKERALVGTRAPSPRLRGEGPGEGQRHVYMLVLPSSAIASQFRDG